MKIYSDDFLMGVKHTELGITKEDYVRHQQDMYNSYGMTLKPSATHVLEKEAGAPVPAIFSFLGSYADYNNGYYFPKPRIDKLTSSIKFGAKSPPGDYLMKLLSLHILAVHEPTLNTILKKLISHHVSKYRSFLKDVELVVHDLLMDPQNIDYVITGRESKFHNFFLDSPSNDDSDYIAMYREGLNSLSIMTSKTVRAEKLLDKLVRERKLTNKGKDWLIGAIDPFHDTDFTPAGWPDVNNAPSLVQLVKQTITVSRPPTLLPLGTTWDLHIYNTPFFCKHPVTGKTNISGANMQIPILGVPTSTLWGGIMAVAGHTGSETGILEGASVVVPGLDIPAEFSW